MAEPSTIARPYADAAFRLADAQGKLAEWSTALANLAGVAADERVRVAVSDPNSTCTSGTSVNPNAWRVASMLRSMYTASRSFWFGFTTSR